MPSNPFKPTAGKNPPVLIGRDYVISEFVEGIENGPGAPSRLMRVSGMRGMGKTVVLNQIAAHARKLKWDVIEETASEGFCERILAAATPGHRVERATVGPSVFGVSLGSIELEQASLGLRETLQQAIEKNKHGLLVTLDEVQDASLPEMRALAVAIQHLIRQDLEIAFVFAGLPSMMESVVNGKTLTFLRRAVPIELGPVGLTEVAASFAETMHDSDVAIDVSLARRLADATHGYPFMIQLVGYHVWQLAHRNAGAVTEDVARAGIKIARERFDMTVIEPALQRLSGTAMAYILAMAEDDGKPSDTKAVAERLGTTTQKASAYRARLIKEDIIEAVSWGKVSFAIPYMADYLNTHREELQAEFAKDSRENR